MAEAAHPGDRWLTRLIYGATLILAGLAVYSQYAYGTGLYWVPVIVLLLVPSFWMRRAKRRA